jgi:phosphomannomutase/phosphoglucomutase
LGGEYSSHYFFGDRWQAVDDGIYAACRVAEIMQLHNIPLNQLLSDFPSLPATEELKIEVSDEQKAEVFEKFRQNANFSGAKIVDIDGLRIEFPDAWGLIRVSNTGPKLSVRFEGETEQALSEVQGAVRQQFEKIFPELNLPF